MFISRKELKDFQQNLHNEETKLQYNSIKDDLNDTYEEISTGIRIRSHCNWYGCGKNSKTFLELRKKSNLSKYSA